MPYAELTAESLRQAAALVGWTAQDLAERAHVSVVEVARVLEDREPMFNAHLNCARALIAAGVTFEKRRGRVVASRDDAQ